MTRRALPSRVVALAGGVGAARLLRGLIRRIPPERLTVVVNTADDDEFYGLHVSPDLDTVVYNLAGAAPPSRGWGLAGDTAHALEGLSRFYPDPWFRLGDRDLATHLHRTEALRRGHRLHEVTAGVADAFDVRSRILPMSNDPVRTTVVTRRGERLSFQRWFVGRRARDPVARIVYRGIRDAVPAPGVLRAIARADLLVFPPSNPFTSILPILGVRGIRAALLARRAPLVAVSPLAGGRAVRGPLGGMLQARGLPVSPLAIARLYRGLLDGLVIDSRDEDLVPRLEREGLRTAVTDVRMPTLSRSRAVASAVLTLAARIRG